MAFAAGPQLCGRWQTSSMRGRRAAAAVAPQRSARAARRCTLAVRAEGDSSGAGAKGRTIELPIFPLNVVALPHATVPLMIFEPRYRVLFNTLMNGAADIEEGLVQKDSPYAGTRRFGMCYVDGSTGRMATVGTTLEIQKHVFEPDGRILVVNKGLERFRVTKVVKEKPVLICEVEVMPEVDDDSSEAKKLAIEVAEMFRNVLRLYRKMRRGRGAGVAGGGGGAAGGAPGAGGSIGEPEEEAEEPEELTEYTPTQLSYWIASVLGEHRLTQQALLEEATTLARLQREADVLGQTLKFYSAATALESVFSEGGSGDGGGGGSGAGGGGSGGSGAPPPGGPD